MAARVAAICRGVGFGYVALVGVEPGAASRVVRASSGEELPSCVVAAPDAVKADAVAIVPLVDEALELEVGGLRLKLGETATKIRSRLYSLTNPRGAEALRGLRPGDIEVIDAWRDGDQVVWHLRCPAADARAVKVWGHDGAAPIVLEEGNDWASVSLRLPDSERTPVFAVGAEHLRGFLCVPSFETDNQLALSRQRANGAAGDPAYAEWLSAHVATKQELSRQREAAAKGGMPQIEVRVVGSVDGQRTKASLEAQTLTPVAEGQGNYVLFLTSGDELEPDALFVLASAILRNPGADLIFADEDVKGTVGYELPALKTPLNRGRLLSYDCVGAPLVLSAGLLEAVGGLPEGAAWHYDLVLRASEKCACPVHVPRVLCHRPDFAPSNDAHEEGRRALLAHLGRCGIVATVKGGAYRCTYRVNYQISRPMPSVSIVIPSKDHADLLRACVESILERTSWPNYDITIVENNSTEPETFALYDELCARETNVRVVMWTEAVAAEQGVEAGTFNYPALVNYGVSRTTGEIVVLLNNDTEVISRDWLQEMAGQLQRPEVGVVGAKLLLADGLIQHAGMVANPNGDFAHVNRCLPANASGYLHTADLPGDFSMVTGACQMVRRGLWDELGGYDTALAVGYNDGDFCLRAGEAGYAVAFTPYALLHHKEFASRGREAGNPEKEARLAAERERFLAAHPDFAANGDPALNPQLDGFSDWYQLRW